MKKDDATGILLLVGKWLCLIGAAYCFMSLFAGEQIGTTGILLIVAGAIIGGIGVILTIKE